MSFKGFLKPDTSIFLLKILLFCLVCPFWFLIGKMCASVLKCQFGRYMALFGFRNPVQEYKCFLDPLQLQQIASHLKKGVKLQRPKNLNFIRLDFKISDNIIDGPRYCLASYFLSYFFNIITIIIM